MTDKRKRLASLFEDMLDCLDAPMHEETRVTPARAAAAWIEMLNGYSQDISCFAKTFAAPAQCASVSVENIAFTSICEHHILPFSGEVCVAYQPDKKLLGLSKFTRITQVFSRRLQLQERLTNEIATALFEILMPQWLTVKIAAQHMCLCARGAHDTGSKMLTECKLIKE